MQPIELTPRGARLRDITTLLMEHSPVLDVRMDVRSREDWDDAGEWGRFALMRVCDGVAYVSCHTTMREAVVAAGFREAGDLAVDVPSLRREVLVRPWKPGDTDFQRDGEKRGVHDLDEGTIWSLVPA
jgi:hypothetical protein